MKALRPLRSLCLCEKILIHAFDVKFSQDFNLIFNFHQQGIFIKDNLKGQNYVVMYQWNWTLKQNAKAEEAVSLY